MRGVAGALITLVLGLVAGVVAGLAIHGTEQTFRPPSELASLQPPLSQENQAKLDAAEAEAALLNTALALGIAGMAICGLLGAGFGIRSGSAPKAIGGFVVGAILGALFGAAGGYANRLVWAEPFGYPSGVVGLSATADGIRKLFELVGQEPENRALWASVVHAVSWVSIAVGLLLTAFLTRANAAGSKVGLTIGLLGAAVVSAMAYPILGGVLFPLAQTESSIPFESNNPIFPADNQIFWVSLTSVLMALVILRVDYPKKVEETAPAEAEGTPAPAPEPAATAEPAS